MKNTHFSPKDFFLNLAITIAVYACAISLLSLLFEVINYSYPSNLDYYVDPYSGALRFAVSTLIIAFPLLLVLIWANNREIAKVPEKRELGVRRWLSYLTLFLAGVTIVVDLVSLVNVFLGGDLSTRFLLKVVSVLAVSAIVFGYYLYSLRRTLSVLAAFNKTFAVLVAIVIVGSVVGAFAVIGSPTHARLVRYDAQKADDIRLIQSQIDSYYARAKMLPISLDDLKNFPSTFNVPVDPQTSKPYEYKTSRDNVTYSLCADFNLPSPLSGENRVRDSYALIHDAGRQCFEHGADARAPIMGLIQP